MPSLQSELYCDAERIYTSMTDEDILQSGMNIYFDVGTDITCLFLILLDTFLIDKLIQ